jgi:hypothetical protein
MIGHNQARNSNSYGFVAGMRNVAFLTGYVASIDRKNLCGTLAVDHNANHNIPWTAESIPGDLKLNRPAKLICRVGGAKEEGLWTVKLMARGFFRVNVLDVPPIDHALYAKRAGIPLNLIAPSTVQEGDPNTPFETMEAEEAAEYARFINRETLPSLITAKMRDNHNVVEVAGFVAGFTLEQAKANDGGHPTGALYVAIRQTADPSNKILVRIMDKRRLKAMKDALTIGTPIYVRGRMRWLVKNTQSEPGADGIIPVRRRFVIEAPDLEIPDFGAGGQIREIPAWRDEMIAQFKASKAQMAAEKQKGGLAKAPQRVAPLVPPADEATSPPVATIDPSVLAALRTATSGATTQSS